MPKNPTIVNGQEFYTKYWRCICPKCKTEITENEVYYPPETFTSNKKPVWLKSNNGNEKELGRQ